STKFKFISLRFSLAETCWRLGETVPPRRKNRCGWIRRATNGLGRTFASPAIRKKRRTLPQNNPQNFVSDFRLNHEEGRWRNEEVHDDRASCDWVHRDSDTRIERRCFNRHRVRIPSRFLWIPGLLSVRSIWLQSVRLLPLPRSLLWAWRLLQ